MNLLELLQAYRQAQNFPSMMGNSAQNPQPGFRAPPAEPTPGFQVAGEVLSPPWWHWKHPSDFARRHNELDRLRKLEGVPAPNNDNSNVTPFVRQISSLFPTLERGLL